jgi:hypothetical protein
MYFVTCKSDCATYLHVLAQWLPIGLPINFRKYIICKAVCDMALPLLQWSPFTLQSMGTGCHLHRCITSCYAQVFIFKVFDLINSWAAFSGSQLLGNLPLSFVFLLYPVLTFTCRPRYPFACLSSMFN